VREGGNVASERGVVNFVDEDTEEGSRLITRVGLKLRINLNDECRGDGRKQTGLIRW
jgi:hypothetical protein